MTRVQADNPVWILCCCGGLPFISLAKGLLCVIPFALFFTLAVAATSLFWLPHDVIHSYNTALHVAHVGPNLRVLTLALLPVPLLVWPPLVTLCTLILTIVTGIFMPAAFTFDDSSDLFLGGVTESFQIGWEYLQRFWEFNSTAVFGMLKDLRERPLAEGEEPFDVSLGQLATALIVAAGGLLVVGVLGGVVVTIYALPCTLKCYRHLWRFYSESWSRAGRREDKLILAMMFPIWVLANAILPVLCGFGWGIGVVCCAGYGVGAAFVSYNRGLGAAWRWILAAPCELERSLLGFLDIRRPIKGPRGKTKYGQQRYAIFVLACIEPQFREEDDDDTGKAEFGAALVSEEDVRSSTEAASSSRRNWAARAVDEASIEAATIKLQEEEQEAAEAAAQAGHAQSQQHKKKKKHRPGH